MHILNKVPTIAVSKISDELWISRKHIWKYPTKAKWSEPHIEAFDPKMIGRYFIGYSKISEGYEFYHSSHSPNIVETYKVKFLEDGSFGLDALPNLTFEKMQGT